MMYEWGSFTMRKTTDSKINHVISLHQTSLPWVEPIDLKKNKAGEIRLMKSRTMFIVKKSIFDHFES